MDRIQIRNHTLIATMAAAIVLLTPAPSLAAPASMTAREVRDQFDRCGFNVSVASTPTEFVPVRDRGAPTARDGDYRVVMAVVYASPAAALTAHREAHLKAEQRLGERWSFSSDNGPQLLGAYGGSVWRGNVALVQSSFRTLASLYVIDGQTDEARLARPELLEIGFVRTVSEYGVDRDFVDCLESAMSTDEATAPLPTAPTAIVSPVFMPGRPW